MNKLVTILYAIFLFSFFLFSYLFLDPNLLYFHKFYTGFAFFNREIATYIFIFQVIVFFLFFFFFLKRKFNLKPIIIITCVILLFSYSAMLSQDIFNYMTTAKVLFKYHENPYIIMPIEFRGEPNLLFTHAANKIALYGPLWIIMSGVPYFLGFGNFILTFFNFKLLIIVFYLLTIFLVKKISRSDYSAALFALNPLVIIETLVGNHNDIVMMFFALLSFFLLSKRKILYAVIFILMSIFIKYSTIFLLPVFIFVVIKILSGKKINWDKIFLYCGISMIVVFLLSAFREEIYPWYAIWFLSFSSLIPRNRILLFISLAFSFGLAFRYVPFMFLGTYFGPTPLIKTAVTFIPVILSIFLITLKKVNE